MLKTFNVDADIYEKYSKHCKKNGVSMSKQVENFLKNEVEKIGIKTNISVKEVEKVNKKINSISELKSGEHPLSKYC